MGLPKVTTIEQARALPELEQDYINQTLPDGMSICTPVPYPVLPISTDDDVILWFKDVDGRSMQVIGTEDGLLDTTVRRSAAPEDPLAPDVKRRAACT